HDAFFDTITVIVGARQKEIAERAVEAGTNLRLIPAGAADAPDSEAALGISVDETTTAETIEAVWRAFGVDARFADLSEQCALPAALRRKSAFLTHPVFHRHRSETEMLRYIRTLSDRDLALDRSMIPLGSCSMKLNATSEMIPVTWPEFGLM